MKIRKFFVKSQTVCRLCKFNSNSSSEHKSSSLLFSNNSGACTTIVFFMGNGGSAADSQHIAAEFVSKLSVDRCPLPAVALTVDTSVITAIGNDYGFNSLFERQIKALCTPKDVVVGISTSGRSNNVIAGFETASEIGAYRIGFSGEDGFHGIDMDHNFKVKSNVTARIQEAHILLGHLLCLVAEKDFVNNALILCGGQGTRFKMISSRPKILAPFREKRLLRGLLIT